MDSGMRPKVHPFSGARNPVAVPRRQYLGRMPARKKLVSHPAQQVREAMVANLEWFIEQRYPDGTRTAAYEKIGKRTGISLSTLQRVMSGDTGPSIDTLADLAHHLGTSVSTILTINSEDQPQPTPPPRAPKPREVHRRSSE